MPSFGFDSRELRKLVNQQVPRFLGRQEALRTDLQLRGRGERAELLPDIFLKETHLLLGVVVDWHVLAV